MNKKRRKKRAYAKAYASTLFFVIIILASSAYAELEPGKLWINGVFIPYIKEEIPTINCTEDQLLGDVNGDGKIDPLDSSFVLKYVGGLVNFDNIRCADVNCDNQITQEDAQLILKYDTGLIKRFPCEKVDAFISIATLKDVYNIGEKIELTDPPDEDNNKVTGNIVKNLDKEFDEEIIDTPEPKYIPGELIIKLKKDKISNINELNQKYNVKRIENVFTVKEKWYEWIWNFIKQLFGFKVHKKELKKVYKLEIPEDTDVEKVAEEYSKDPNVEYAEPNYIYELANVIQLTGNPSFSKQWAHQNTQVEQGWDITKGSSDVIIALIDTGVDYNHKDLKDNIWINDGEDLNHNGIVDDSDFNGKDDDGNNLVDDIRGWDFFDNDNDPMDDDDHGTHNAGIIAANGNIDNGVVGVCPNCKIMPLKGVFSYMASKAIYYAADKGAKVISMSFIGASSKMMKDALDYAYSKGVVLIAGAGNSNDNWKNYPAAFNNVISVSGTAIDDSKASYSTYGYWVDVAAPGGDINKDTLILSTVRNNWYVFADGTSRSCPYVAGLVGLLLSKKKGYNPEEVRQILRQNVDPVNSDKYIGTGRVNVKKALEFEPIDAIAKISSPEKDEVISNNIDITGTATGDSYTVYYGEGNYPSEWIEIGSGTKVNNGVLASWDIENIDFGGYIIKLRVEKGSRFVEDFVGVTITVAAEISFPKADIIFPTTKNIDIIGTATGDSYTVYYAGEEAFPNEWIEIGSGTSVVNGVLANWNMENVEVGWYAIKLSVSKNTKFVGGKVVAVVIIRPQSKIVNNEDFDLNSYLTIKIQKGEKIIDILEENIPKTYELEGKKYEVIAFKIASGVQFIINSEEQTEIMMKGDTFKLKDGTEIGVTDILKIEEGEKVGKNIFEFFLKSWKDYQTVDEQIIVLAKRDETSGLLKLDKIFNLKNVKINKIGKYRVYAALQDRDGKVIKTKDGELRAEWEFRVTE